MAFPTSEKWSPFIEWWEFEDEVGIFLDIGRFITPNQSTEDVGARISDAIINDGRRMVCRTETFYGVDNLTLTFAYMPYNYAMELRNRTGARLRIKNYLGDHLWVILRAVHLEPLHMHITLRSEQRYNVVAEFAQVNPT